MNGDQTIFRQTLCQDGVTLQSSGPEQTHVMGVALGRALSPGDVVGLNGELGAGKTHLAAGVAEGAGVPDEVAVSSPTFTLINEYPGRLLIVHIDLYRLGGEDELWELGLDHYLGREGACLVEWFERFGDALDAERTLQLRLLVEGDEERRIEGRAGDERHLALLGRWQAEREKGPTE